MPSTEFNQSAQEALLGIARASIVYGLSNERPLEPELPSLAGTLRADGASFVTLKADLRLRGCVGTLTATQPLATDVARNAYSAAFADPRFPRVRADEVPYLTLAVSVLGKPVPLPVATETELLASLRPGVDGLILEGLGRRATFLPDVWEELDNPRDFVSSLKRKAGLDGTFWSGALRFSRYHTYSFEERVG